MKIKQCYSAFGHFGNQLRKKYGLTPYKNKKEPVLFYGCYGTQIEKKLLQHESDAVVLWSGSDSSWFINQPKLVERVKSNPKIKHIAWSKWIAEDLDKVGIPYKFIPLTTHKNDDIYPKALGRSIYVYKPYSSLYGGDFYRQIKKKLNKQFDFIEARNHHVFNRKELLDVYSKCFMALRMTKHDGLSHTVVEMGLMGRRVVWNGTTPNAINYETVDDVIEAILQEYKKVKGGSYHIAKKLSNEMKNYLDEVGDFLELDNWNGHDK